MSQDLPVELQIFGAHRYTTTSLLTWSTDFGWSTSCAELRSHRSCRDATHRYDPCGDLLPSALGQRYAASALKTMASAVKAGGSSDAVVPANPPAQPTVRRFERARMAVLW